jgi:DNA-directed RNA polymerase subunit M/transcription elongation factor TFIIS
MDITFNCDKCGQHIAIDEAGAGQLVDCPKCGKPLEVPDKSQPLDEAASLPTAVTKPFSPTFMLCPHCGKDVFATGSVCVHCGQSIHKQERSKDHHSIPVAAQDFAKLRDQLGITSTPPAKLVRCPDCGREVSRRAATCPHCGAPLDVATHTIDAGETIRFNQPLTARTPNLPAEVSQIPFDNILAYYGLSIILPLIGFFAGIYLLAKKEPGHGVACMVVSIVSAGIWAAIIKSW